MNNKIEISDLTPEQIAQSIVARLSGYAKEDARVWAGHGKARIYFGRQFIEVRSDKSVNRDTKNPYSVLGQIEDMGIEVR